MFSRAAIANKCCRACSASFTVAMVLARACGICATNSASQEYLCQLGAGFMSNGALAVNIHLRPLSSVEGLFQTSALLTESCPPLAKEVSIAG